MKISTSSIKKNLIVATPYIIIIASCLAIYFQALTFDYIEITDDEQNILTHHHDFGRIWTEKYRDMYIPITYSIWSGIWHITQLPSVFHAVNLFFHIVNSLLVFVLIGRLMSVTVRWRTVAALMFAAHPLQVEPVAWITGLKDVLSATFVLSGLIFLSHGRTAVFATLAVTGCLVKPVAAVSGLAGLVLFPKHWRASLAVFVVCAGLCAWSVSSQVSMQDYTVLSAVGVFLDNIGNYATAVIIPQLSPMPEHKRVSFLFVVGLTVLVIAAWRRSRPAAVVFIFLLPVLGLVPFKYMAWSNISYRYMYLPMFGVALLVAGLSRRSLHKNIFYGLVVFLAALTVSSYKYCANWSDFITMSKHVFSGPRYKYITTHTYHGALRLKPPDKPITLRLISRYYARRGMEKEAKAFFQLSEAAVYVRKKPQRK